MRLASSFSGISLLSGSAASLFSQAWRTSMSETACPLARCMARSRGEICRIMCHPIEIADENSPLANVPSLAAVRNQNLAVAMTGWLAHYVSFIV